MDSKSKTKRFKFSFKKSNAEENHPEIDQILDYNRRHPIPGNISPIDSCGTPESDFKLESDPYQRDNVDNNEKKKSQRHHKHQRSVSMEVKQSLSVEDGKVIDSPSDGQEISNVGDNSEKIPTESPVNGMIETKTQIHIVEKVSSTITEKKAEKIVILTPRKAEKFVLRTPKKAENVSLQTPKKAEKFVLLTPRKDDDIKSAPTSPQTFTFVSQTSNEKTETPTPSKESPKLPEMLPVIQEKTTEKTTMVVPPCPRYSLGFLNDLQNKHKFSKAVSKQNEVATTAIQSLDCLNDQIVQYIVSSQCQLTKDGEVRMPNESVQSSMVLIRRLLLDAQARFRKMVEDNKQLANHIDTSIQAANQEVSLLRAELASTNKKLHQINHPEDMGKVDKGTQVEKDFSKDIACGGEKSDSDKEDMETTVQTLAKENEQLLEDYKRLIDDHDALKCAQEDLKHENEHLKAENARQEQQLRNLRKDYEELRLAKHEPSSPDNKPSYGELKLELIQTKQELNRAKEVLQGMKSDRKRLKGEKLDLLSQMKQLYSTLEEKETELRDFIRNYEQRVKESDDMIKQLAKEKEDVENEKWDIITKAKDAAERAMFLKTQLDNREQTLKEMETKLKEVQEQLASQDNNITSTTGPNTIITDIDDDIAVADDNGFSTMEESSVLNCTFQADQDNGAQIFSTSPISTTDSTDASSLVFKWFTQSSDFEIPLESKPSKKKKKSFGSLSRVFSKGRMRRSIVLPHAESLIADDTSPKLCVLSQDNYQEKLNTIEKMVGVHMRDWRAHQVLAWLEITLAMPMYAQNCLMNVKSGRILLGLSDSELSAALGVTNTMHRRKLRIAIEQHRNPNEIKYLKASEMDPTWIAHRFLPDLGLPQYTDIFEEQLCDGHVLNTLTRRDLEKHFSVHRKFHQSSILHAIELLRRIDFNKEKLYHRRNLCEDKDTDLIVWTNERLMKWTRSIDLGEYCESLVESGVHGALMVLEPSFNADTLAAIMGIPPSKSYIRRHLASELDNILKPARAALDTAECKGGDNKNSSSKNRKGSQDKGLRVLEDKGRRKSAEEGRSRLSFRGSLGRAFGKKVRDDLKIDSDPSKLKISAPIPIQHSSLSSLNSDSELVKKGFCIKEPSKDIYKCKPIKDPKINGIAEQDLRRLCLTKSEQTLNKSFEIVSSGSRSPKEVKKVVELKEVKKVVETQEVKKAEVPKEVKKDVDVKNSTQVLQEIIRDMKLNDVEEEDKSSKNSSQETLTEQSVKYETNNNLKKDLTSQNNGTSHHSLSEFSPKTSSKKTSPNKEVRILSPETTLLVIKPICKRPGPELFKRHSSWVGCETSSQKTTTLRPPEGQSKRHSSISAMDQVVSKDGCFSRESKFTTIQKGSLPGLLPQTTSV
ncbi:kazrin-like isoform X2 [Physella acuta]|uniref:kazrin-like isoform X2 n=1 Tax=Physella acuta TaxID=109671 RepID=UPI0027DB45A4|nr:kazrin-like isoform X2 [Physella acuta]